jgi:pantetheine-phosphate adenylyltransferase
MDFEYEMQMSMMNSRLCPEVESMFVVTRPEYMYVSSSSVKEAALLGGNVNGLVPPNVEQRLAEKRKLYLEGRGSFPAMSHL